MKKMIRLGWKPISLLVFLLLFWELYVKIMAVPEWLLPAPSAIFKELYGGFPQWYGHLLPTTFLAITGLVIGSVIGVVTAIILHLVPFVRQAFYPILIVSQNIPIIVLAPLLVIWFGFGMLPKVIVIVLVCFFPITIALLDGFKQTSPDLLHYMKMAGATKGQIFTKLEWPHALPSLFSGLKISATYSVMGAVISEWLGANKGLGVYMTLSSSSFRTDRVFVAIFIVVLLSLLFFACILMIEKKMIKWKGAGGKNNGKFGN